MSSALAAQSIITADKLINNASRYALTTREHYLQHEQAAAIQQQQQQQQQQRGIYM
jgi:hypothetical protein